MCMGVRARVLAHEDLRLGVMLRGEAAQLVGCLALLGRERRLCVHVRVHMCVHVFACVCVCIHSCLCLYAAYGVHLEYTVGGVA